MNESPRNLILSYASYYGESFESFIQIAHEQGFRAVQLTPDQAPNLYSEFPRQRRDALCTLAKERGITLHLHNVFYDINPVSLVPEVRDAALRITRQVLELGADLEAHSVTVHPGYMFWGWRRDQVQRERFWNEAATSLRQLGNTAKEFGLDLLLENGSYFITTATGFSPRPLHVGIEPNELRTIVSMTGDEAGVVLDINKAIHSGIQPIKFVEELRPQIRQLQISTTDRYRDEITEVVDALSSNGHALSYVLEGSRDEVASGSTLVKELNIRFGTSEGITYLS